MKWHYHALILFVSFNFVGSFSGYDSSYALLNVLNTANNESETLCVNYQQWQTKPLPSELNYAKALLFNWSSTRGVTNLCSADDTKNVSGKVIPGDYRLNQEDVPSCPPELGGNRAFEIFTTWEARKAQDLGANALLLLVNRGEQYFTGNFNDYLFNQFSAYPFNDSSINLNVFFTYRSTFNETILGLARSSPESLVFRFYRPASSVLDLALFLVFFSAVFCVIIGGIWSGHRRMTIWKCDIDGGVACGRLSAGGEERTAYDCKDVDEGVGNDMSPDHNKPSKNQKEEAAQSMGWKSIICYIFFIVLMIMVLYFFYDKLVWVIIIMYVFASALATYSCLSEALEPVNCGRCRVCLSFNQCLRCELFPCEPCRARPMIRDMIIFLGAISLSISWCIFRKWAYAFILQDILSVFFCIHLIKSLRIPNLMYISLLIGLLLIYDLFMVFITPYITTLPILFKYPRMGDPLLKCYDLSVDLQYPPMMLGLGDVIIPGFLVGYCFAIDFIYKTDRFVYGSVASIGYAVGLILTFTCLFLMESAQPALIYLVPCTWIPVVITALIKRQFCVLWKGIMPVPCEMTSILPTATCTTNLDDQDVQEIPHT